MSILSRELRNPLHTILGWLRVLHQQVPIREPAQLQQGLEIIERNANLMFELLQDLLDIARITYGKIRLHTCLLDLDVVLRLVVENIAFEARAKNLAIVTDFNTLPEKVLGDPTRLQQVFGNLLMNAIKFTPAGGQIEIALSAISLLDNAINPTHVQVQVSDTGPGISSEAFPYIFDRFQQQKSDFVPSNTGLGLGLTIVRSLVEQHGGTVDVANQIAGGAIFTVNLPLQSQSPLKPDNSPDFLMSVNQQ